MARPPLPIIPARDQGYAFLQRTLNEAFKRLGEALDGVNAALEAAGIATDAAAVAQAAAAAADAAATAAGANADGIAAADSLSKSYVTGLSLSADDAGADARITVSAHTRIYANGDSVTVDSGTVTGLAYGTRYWVYYDQASRAGGAVTYLAQDTVTGNGTASPDRHLVGAIITPFAADPPNLDGIPVLPPGAFFFG